MTLARLLIVFGGGELPRAAAKRIKERGVAGRLPVVLAGLYPRVHGLPLWA